MSLIESCKRSPARENLYKGLDSVVMTKDGKALDILYNNSYTRGGFFPKQLKDFNQRYEDIKIAQIVFVILAVAGSIAGASTAGFSMLHPISFSFFAVGAIGIVGLAITMCAERRYLKKKVTQNEIVKTVEEITQKIFIHISHHKAGHDEYERLETQKSQLNIVNVEVLQGKTEKQLLETLLNEKGKDYSEHSVDPRHRYQIVAAIGLAVMVIGIALLSTALSHNAGRFVQIGVGGTLALGGGFMFFGGIGLNFSYNEKMDEERVRKKIEQLRTQITKKQQKYQVDRQRYQALKSIKDAFDHYRKTEETEDLIEFTPTQENGFGDLYDEN